MLKMSSSSLIEQCFLLKSHFVPFYDLAKYRLNFLILEICILSLLYAQSIPLFQLLAYPVGSFKYQVIFFLKWFLYPSSASKSFTNFDVNCESIHIKIEKILNEFETSKKLILRLSLFWGTNNERLNLIFWIMDFYSAETETQKVSILLW